MEKTVRINEWTLSALARWLVDFGGGLVFIAAMVALVLLLLEISFLLGFAMGQWIFVPWLELTSWS
jgi:hypothetical protein